MKIKIERVSPDPSGDAPPCTTYQFRANGEQMFGRRWDNDMRTAELIHWRNTSKKFHIFEGEIPYYHDLFRQAVRYYVDSQRIKNVLVLVFPPGQRGKRRPTMKRVDLRRIQKPRK